MIGILRAILISTVMILATIVGVPIMIALAVLKLLIPVHAVRQGLTRAITGIAWLWSEMARGAFAVFGHIEWDVRSEIPHAPNRSALLIANHQSWVDIPVLIRNFNNRIPFYKFFVKRQLIWVPLIGLAMWALEFPMMRRYTREQLEQNPHLRGRDLEATRRVCENFRHMPVTFINFPEGTRFTPKKYQAQQSPYRHLLRPRAGGMAFVLESMGELIDTIYDVTITYPEGTPTFVDLLMGRPGRIVVTVEAIAVPPELRQGGYQNDPAFRARFQEWVSDLWTEKDARIDAIKAEQSPTEQQATRRSER